MAAAFIPSFKMASTTVMDCEVLYIGADVSGTLINGRVSVTGLDLVNDTMATVGSKIAAAVRAATAGLANGSGGTGFTVAANAVFVPTFTKL